MSGVHIDHTAFDAAQPQKLVYKEEDVAEGKCWGRVRLCVLCVCCVCAVCVCADICLCLCCVCYVLCVCCVCAVCVCVLTSCCVCADEEEKKEEKEKEKTDKTEKDTQGAAAPWGTPPEAAPGVFFQHLFEN